MSGRRHYCGLGANRRRNQSYEYLAQVTREQNWIVKTGHRQIEVHGDPKARYGDARQAQAFFPAPPERDSICVHRIREFLVAATLANQAVANSGQPFFLGSRRCPARSTQHGAGVRAPVTPRRPGARALEGQHPGWVDSAVGIQPSSG